MSIYITQHNETSYYIEDHFGGFDANLRNPVLDSLPNDKKITVATDYIFGDVLDKNYPNIEFKFEPKVKAAFLGSMQDYKIHPEINFKNFICSFNGSSHVSRKLLVSILKKFDYFNKAYSSKNFTYSVDMLDGHLTDCVGDRANFYRKFFISDNSEDFFQTIHTFGNYSDMHYDHRNNIYNVETKLTESFLHIVSENIATSYYPFITEKFAYSVVTRGLFLTYGAPGWHDHLEKYHGFKKYNKIFDYRFDNIQNPVERLVELITMASKFSVLTQSDWQDLYQMEQETIEYNYDHYMSGDHLRIMLENTK